VPLLEVRGLRTYFATREGDVKGLLGRMLDFAEAGFNAS